MSLRLLQDPHLVDESFWVEFQYYWKNKNYNKALQILQNNQELVSKYVDADWFNSLTNLIYNLELLPDNLNKKQVIVSYLPPDLDDGDIWFQLNVDGIKINVYMNFIFPNSTSVTINYTNKLIEALAFENNELILTDEIIDETNSRVTFSLGKSLDKTVVCMVYSSDDENIVVANSSVSVGTNNFQMSYSGTLLSAMYLDQLNNRNITNLLIQDSIVKYVLKNNTTEPTKGRLVYIPTNQLSNILNTSSSLFSTTTSILLCGGYFVNGFLKDYSTNEVLIGDINFVLKNLIINVPQNVDTSIKCDIYYT